MRLWARVGEGSQGLSQINCQFQKLGEIKGLTGKSASLSAKCLQKIESSYCEKWIPISILNPFDYIKDTGTFASVHKELSAVGIDLLL